MFTQCPQCRKTFSLSIEELHHHPKIVFCPHCEDMLGRLKLLNATFFSVDEQRHSINTPLWGIGTLLCLFLLLYQFYLIDNFQFLQNPQIRFWLEKVSQNFAYSLPPYSNVAEIAVLHSDFTIEQQTATFQIVFTNQALFAQAYPKIRLNLLNFQGKVFAQRIFYPHEYLAKNPENIFASETVEIRLVLVKPAQKIGGFSVDLL